MSANVVTIPQQTMGAALVPTNMQDAMRLAEMMAKAGFLAKELQTPGGALFVIEQSMRWNMSPFAVAMETSFIQSKPMFSGKVVAAAVTSSGAINGRLHYDYTGDGDNRRVTVTGTLRGETEPRTVTVALKDARTNNRVWQSQPDQQLAYHGARVWARRHAPEVMLGVMSPEELDAQPMKEATVIPDGLPAPREPAPAGSMRAEAEAMETRLILDPEDMTLKNVPARAWRRAVTRALEKSHDLDTLNGWWQGMAPVIDNDDERAAVEALVVERRAALAEMPA